MRNHWQNDPDGWSIGLTRREVAVSIPPALLGLAFMAAICYALMSL